ncbi:uncharacterized protein LOC143181619 [Calliopsis andreniformis]|uniref:uncharacterized protein LOC143181619 n=1 Tax=Calliopsis andreniformis TaxID=337506 RepID=UPI003FCD31DC
MELANEIQAASRLSICSFHAEVLFQALTSVIIPRQAAHQVHPGCKGDQQGARSVQEARERGEEGKGGGVESWQDRGARWEDGGQNLWPLYHFTGLAASQRGGQDLTMNFGTRLRCTRRTVMES